MDGVGVGRKLHIAHLEVIASLIGRLAELPTRSSQRLEDAQYFC